MIRASVGCLVLSVLLASCTSAELKSDETTPTPELLVTDAPVATSPPLARAITPTTSETNPETNRDPIIADLENVAIPIDSTDPGSPADDISPFLELVGEAKIIGLGEATHGTSEFVKFRIRIIQLLIEKEGFRQIALEAPWTGIEVVNQYIQGESDDREAARDGLAYWMFRNEEFWKFVEWAREYNAIVDAAGRIHFTGIDPQEASEAAVEIVLDFVALVDPDNLGEFEDHYEHIRDVSGSSVSRADTQAAYELLDDRRDEYIALSSEYEFEYALQASRVIYQAQQIHAAPITESIEGYRLREEAMADNLDWARKKAGPDSQFALWGHNTHVAKRNPAPWEEIPPLGGLLYERHGKDYVSVGLDFASGSFVARPIGEITNDLTTFEVDSSPEGSFAQLLEQMETGSFMLDLRDLDHTSPAGEWLEAPHPMWSIGCCFSPEGEANVITVVDLPATYDILFFIRETTAITPLSTGR